MEALLRPWGKVDQIFPPGSQSSLSPSYLIFPPNLLPPKEYQPLGPHEGHGAAVCPFPILPAFQGGLGLSHAGSASPARSGWATGDSALEGRGPPPPAHLPLGLMGLMSCQISTDPQAGPLQPQETHTEGIRGWRQPETSRPEALSWPPSQEQAEVTGPPPPHPHQRHGSLG